MTYKEAFDKLTEAYIMNRVNPYDFCACFIGNLLDRESSWKRCRMGYNIGEGNGEVIGFRDIGIYKGYTSEEITTMEGNFLNVIYKETNGKTKNSPSYEDALFTAFESTLDILKEIHLSKGEVIDETPVFTKRKLETV